MCRDGGVMSNEPTALEKALADMFIANGFDAEDAAALTEEVMIVLNDGQYRNSKGILGREPDGEWVRVQTDDDWYTFESEHWRAADE
jgi:hypothetical protein